jgi:ribosome-associated translation inhibitor RaiA
MQLPIQVVFRNMEQRAAIEEEVLQRAAQLERFAGQIISCRVVIEPAGKHHHHGNQYCVHLDVKMPGREIVAGYAPAERTAHCDVSVAVRDAFDAVRRQIEDYARRRRGNVKRHETPPSARASRLVQDEDQGILTAPDVR